VCGSLLVKIYVDDPVFLSKCKHSITSPFAQIRFYICAQVGISRVDFKLLANIGLWRNLAKGQSECG
jgi:hypothetical protein